MTGCDFISDGEALKKEHGQTGRLNTDEGDYWASAAEGRNTGDVSKADSREEETEAKKTQNMTDMTTWKVILDLWEVWV